MTAVELQGEALGRRALRPAAVPADGAVALIGRSRFRGSAHRPQPLPRKRRSTPVAVGCPAAYRR